MPHRLGRFAPVAIGALVVSIVLMIVGVVRTPREASVAFIVAYAATVSVVLGVLAMTMIEHLTTVTWFRAFRPLAMRVLRALPALACLGILMLLTLPTFPWAVEGSEISTTDVAAYLNAPFFVVRFMVYWTVWLLIARALRRANQLEASGDLTRVAEHHRRVSVIGVLALGVTMTFAAFDWMMSLTPDWSSTIYGVIWFAGGIVGALALLAVLASRASRGKNVTYDFDALGKLLLTFILFWLYTGFAQYIVIWSGGLPREVTWYVARTRGGWGGLASVLLFAGFAFPFLLLIVRVIRQSAACAAAIGVALLVAHYLDTLWIVSPGLISASWWTLALAIAALVVVLTIVIGSASMHRGISVDTLVASARLD
jgi:hypothetical protein